MLLRIQHDTTYRYGAPVETAQHLAHLQPVGQRVTTHDFAHWVGQGGDIPQSLGDGCDAERQPVAEHLPFILRRDAVRPVDPFEAGHGGGGACTSVARAGPAGTIPEGCKGKRAPK